MEDPFPDLFPFESPMIIELHNPGALTAPVHAVGWFCWGWLHSGCCSVHIKLQSLWSLPNMTAKLINYISATTWNGAILAGYIHTTLCRKSVILIVCWWSSSSGPPNNKAFFLHFFLFISKSSAIFIDTPRLWDSIHHSYKGAENKHIVLLLLASIYFLIITLGSRNKKVGLVKAHRMSLSENINSR